MHLEETINDDIYSNYYKDNQSTLKVIFSSKLFSCFLYYSTRHLIYIQFRQTSMNQEQMLKDHLQTYNCQICFEKAHRPILTRCGHLYCWGCFYKQSEISEVTCNLCGSINDKSDTYPLFIEQNIEKQQDANIPERPLPLNRPKIPNADIVGTRSNQYKNNIVMGRQLAGSIFIAPLSISAYNQIDDPEDGDIEKPMSIKLKWVFIIIISLLILFFGVYLLV